MTLLNQNNYPSTCKLFESLLHKEKTTTKPIFTPLQKSTHNKERLQLMPQIENKKPTPRIAEPQTSAPMKLENLESMIDLFLIGTDTQGRPEIHLSLKDDVVDGLYIRLQKKQDGSFHAFFISKTYSMKNRLENHVAQLIQKLQDKGSKISSHEITVGDTMPDVN